MRIDYSGLRTERWGNLLFLWFDSSCGILDYCSPNVHSLHSYASLFFAPLMLSCPYDLLVFKAGWSDFPTLEFGLGYWCASSDGMLASIKQREAWNVLGILGSTFHHEKNRFLINCWFKEVKGYRSSPGPNPQLGAKPGWIQPRSAEPQLTHISVHSRNKDPPPNGTEFCLGLLCNAVVARAADTGGQQSYLFFRLNIPTPFNWSLYAFPFLISARFHSNCVQLGDTPTKSHQIRIRYICSPLPPLPTLPPI